MRCILTVQQAPAGAEAQKVKAGEHDTCNTCDKMWPDIWQTTCGMTRLHVFLGVQQSVTCSL